LLLLRIRDELRMTVAAYQTLYESSIAYGMRKALHSEHSRSELEAAIRQLEGEVAELTGQVDATRQKVKGVEERERAREAAENERHSAEVAALRGRNAELKAELETLLSVSSPAQPPAQSVKA
jgi:dynein light intermediate chain